MNKFIWFLWLNYLIGHFRFTVYLQIFSHRVWCCSHFSVLSYVQLGTPMQELFQHSGWNQTGLEASEVDPAICQITKPKIKRPKTPKVIHMKILSHGSTTRSFKTRNPIRKPAIAPKAWEALDVIVSYPFHWNEV